MAKHSVRDEHGRFVKQPQWYDTFEQEAQKVVHYEPLEYRAIRNFLYLVWVVGTIIGMAVMFILGQWISTT